MLGSGPQPHQLFSQSAEQKLHVTKCKVKAPKAGVEKDQWNGVWKTHRLLGPRPGFKFQPCHQPTCVILSKLINLSEPVSSSMLLGIITHITQLSMKIK